MLAIPLETLSYIVAKAREFDAEVPPVDEDPGSNPSDDMDRDVLEDTADNPTLQELIDAIESLNEPQKIELLTLVWLGRGDFTKDEWRDALRQARDVHDRKETDYLVGTPLLADYIEEGVALLGLSLEEFTLGHM